MKKPSNQHSFSVLYLNLLLIFGTVASAHAETLHTPSAGEDPCSHESRNTGALIGGLVGLGLSIFGKGDTETKAIATIVGAGVGGLIGNEMDVRRCELERIAKAHNLELLTAEIPGQPDSAPNAAMVQSTDSKKVESVGLSVAVIDQGGGQFQSNSDKLQPEAESAFRDIAKQYSVKQQMAQLPVGANADNRRLAEGEYRKKRILLIGHTDDSGSSQLNADLSERRARAVAKLFYAEGVPAENVFYQGAGETLPVADNHDEAGRAKNRRVEIVDTADEKKFQAYLASRKPNVAFYRPADSTSLAEDRSAERQSGAVKNKLAAHTPSSDSAALSVSPPILAGVPSAPVASGKHGQTAGTLSMQTGGAVRDRETAGFNFGGEPVSGTPPKLDIGTIAYNHGFTLSSLNPIKAAQAADEPIAASASCLVDRPRVANAVKSLRDDKSIKTSEYLPGLNNAAWAGVVNGQTVALTHVSVLRDGATPTGKPDVLVYRDFDPTKPNQKSRKADFNGSPDVSVYRGDKGVLYRVFSAGPVRCMDVVIPNSNTAAAPASWLYYQKDGQTYRAAYLAHLAR